MLLFVYAEVCGFWIIESVEKHSVQLGNWYQFVEYGYIECLELWTAMEHMDVHSIEDTLHRYMFQIKEMFSSDL